MEPNIVLSTDLILFRMPEILPRPGTRPLTHLAKLLPTHNPPNFSLGKLEHLEAKKKQEQFKEKARVLLSRKKRREESEQEERRSRQRKRRAVSKKKLMSREFANPQFQVTQKEIKRSIKNYYNTYSQGRLRRERPCRHLYQLERQIGKGSFATVFLSRSLSGEEVAVKAFESRDLLNFNRRSIFYKQIQILKKLDHPRVVKFLDQFSEGSLSCIVMDYAKGQQLSALLKQHGKLSEGRACGYFKQLLEALCYIHGKNIAHRDIKLQNIMIDRDHSLRLIDFGLAVQQRQGESKMFCGTPNYMCPEIISKKKYDALAADMWSAGILLYILLVGKAPFRAGNTSQLYRQIRQEQPQFPDEVSYQARRVIKLCLQRQPDKRVGAEELSKMNWLR